VLFPTQIDGEPEEAEIVGRGFIVSTMVSAPEVQAPLPVVAIEIVTVPAKISAALVL